MRRIPWFVFACFILVFLGGGFTVALFAIALLIYIPLATFLVDRQGPRETTMTAETTHQESVPTINELLVGHEAAIIDGELSAND